MEELLSVLEEVMDLDCGTLSLQDNLSDYPEWDSISILAFVATVEERTGKTLDSETVKSIKTVEEALNFLVEK